MTANPNSRLEAFCDGVFAIAITLLIIDLKAPSTAAIRTSHSLWLALADLLPSVFAFLLSFGIVFITWVNHHEAMKLVDKSSTAFIYANGFLLLTVVIVPFPTALLGENLLTDHASPAVVLYSANYAVQAVGWWLVTRTALGPPPLTRNAHAAAKTRKSHRDSYFAFLFYTACAIGAVWLPLTIAVVITLSWIVWLIEGIKLRSE
jgi:TMEM175 potassium channel family protein